MMTVTLLFGSHGSTSDPEIRFNFEKLSLNFTVLALKGTETFLTLVSAKAFQ